MSAQIQILPEHIANQIAAGEVINRPCAAVKELLENALDAGASEISLIIKEGGRSLIQVIDNGRGMDYEDAQICFLAHATSKIRKSQDLYNLHTMGFRGEALASIAAVCQICLKTRTQEDELGCQVNIQGEKTEVQACACPLGTSIELKNIYYNTPARREFLKSNELEFRYIEDEFIKIAFSNPQIKFTFYKDDKIIYQLDACHCKQRICQIWGNSFQNRLIALGEDLNNIKLEGYICKPEFSNKTRNKQFLFVNGRYVKHYGLNSAIEKSFKDLIPDKNYPGYLLFIEIDPKQIDVNIHPSKTEIRFVDEKFLYGLLNSLIKHSLGINNILPSLDFESTESFQIPPLPKNYIPISPELKLNPDFNPFERPLGNSFEKPLGNYNEISP